MSGRYFGLGVTLLEIGWLTCRYCGRGQSYTLTLGVFGVLDRCQHVYPIGSLVGATLRLCGHAVAI